ncbi:hypothetical protein [Bacillus sp. NMTD17]|uniref:hypothetical protein n=1 Tax=Bacillus sp. NMTD17 TaxID=2108547 RepID=UPI000D04762D|nr:hypothetical protein [Bacillus sp. NMTD17]PRS67568.1 hypothetical protein C6347_15930 [Bacillus sp. NMTD17]
MISELWEIVKDNIAVIAAILSLITAILSATIAYFYTIKHKDLDRFYKNAESNLYNLIEPMFYKMENIKNLKDTYHKMENIKKFFDTYNPETINVSKLGNRRLINRFIDSHEAFRQYLIEFDEKSLRILLSKFDSLEYYLKEEYWMLFEAIYKDHNWFKRTVGMNYIFRFFARISAFFENTFYAVTCIIFVFVFFVIGDELNPKVTLINADFKDKLRYTVGPFFISLLFLNIFIFFNRIIADDTKQKKTISDHLTLGATYLWKKVAVKLREKKMEKAIRKEERARATSIEEND